MAGVTIGVDCSGFGKLSKILNKTRNAVERMLCRLKNCRRIATRYDKIATNFLSAIYLAAAVTWWL